MSVAILAPPIPLIINYSDPLSSPGPIASTVDSGRPSRASTQSPESSERTGSFKERAHSTAFLAYLQSYQRFDTSAYPHLSSG